MNCPRCRHQNESGAKFCEVCAAPLLRTCTQCGHALSQTAKFCPECAQPAGPASTPTEQSHFGSPNSYTPEHLVERILTSKAALEGERKQVTVLFADLKGSMELLADRDPEEARKILDPVLEHMMEAVHHYEGTVNQVMGDGIMALFGAPLAHEDHAVRACYAALRMQDRVRRHADEILQSHGVPIRIRIGLNSGEVVVRSIGNDLHMDYTAVGQTTHLAARMEQMADPGSILATANTLELVKGYVEATSLGRLPVRGLQAAVDVYTIVGRGVARWRLEAAAAARGLTGFVGREDELAQLGSAMQSAAGGRGQVVGVVGEPGVGKSRLFHEFTRGERMPGWRILKTGAASYGTATAYRPVIDLLRAYFEVHDRDNKHEVREKITGKVLALDQKLSSMVPALLSLFHVPVDDPQWRSLDPRQRRQQTMDAVRQLLLRESQVQPMCMVFEDLHWIDSETQAFLDSLIVSLPTARILLLVNHRPEYRHKWGSKSYYTQVRVDTLPPQNAGELLRLLLGDDGQLAPLKQLLIEQTRGNPFFLEESARMEVEDGTLVGEWGAYRLAKPVQTFRVPATVETVLAARIDRLAPEDKRLLQAASVIGENVPVVLLQAVAEMPESEFRDGLVRLRGAEFLYDISLLPELYYVFKHGLTRRVAYNSLLRERRRTLHARIVDAIERLYPERLGEHVEQLAQHARDGELWDRAARYLRKAATKAFAHSANQEAVVWFEQALKALGRLPDTAGTRTEAVDLHIGLRNALTLLGENERTLEHLREAQALAEGLGDRRRLGRALSFEVNALLLLGQHERAIESGRRARTIAEELGDISLRTVTDLYVGRAHLYLGDFARAIEVLGAIVATLTGPLTHDHLGIPTLPSVFARSHLVASLAQVGRFNESARYSDEAMALAETTNHPDTLFWATYSKGGHHLSRGEVGQAAEALERAYSVCRTHDMPAYQPRVSAELGLAWALDGRAAEAVPMVQQAVEEAAVRQQPSSYSHVLLLLAGVYFLVDRLAEGAEAATRALTHFRQRRERGHEAYALWVLGNIAARHNPTEVADAETYYNEAIALAETLGMRPLLARSNLGLGRLLCQMGQMDCARQAFQSACAHFRELGMSADLARGEAEIRAVV